LLVDCTFGGVDGVADPFVDGKVTCGTTGVVVVRGLEIGEVVVIGVTGVDVTVADSPVIGISSFGFSKDNGTAGPEI